MVVVNVYNHSTWEVDAGLTVLGSMWWKEKTDSCKLPSDPLYTHSLSLFLSRVPPRSRSVRRTAQGEERKVGLGSCLHPPVCSVLREPRCERDT